MKKIEQIKITLKMKKKIAECNEYFFGRTKGGHMINYLNGFIGVGIFNELQHHITKNVNSVWIYGIGFNQNGTRIIENTNCELTLDEAEDLQGCLKIAIKQLKGGGR